MSDYHRGPAGPTGRVYAPINCLASPASARPCRAAAFAVLGVAPFGGRGAPPALSGRCPRLRPPRGLHGLLAALDRAAASALNGVRPFRCSPRGLRPPLRGGRSPSVSLGPPGPRLRGRPRLGLRAAAVLAPWRPPGVPGLRPRFAAWPPLRAASARGSAGPPPLRRAWPLRGLRGSPGAAGLPRASRRPALPLAPPALRGLAAFGAAWGWFSAPAGAGCGFVLLRRGALPLPPLLPCAALEIKKEVQQCTIIL